jgi:hypothetical protein
VPPEAVDRPAPDPDAIAAQSFTRTRKGFEVDEVRAYLVDLASQVREANRRSDDANRRLVELERRATDPRDLSEEQVTQLLGEETARVLETARKAAADIRAKAEAEAAEATGSADAQATATREAADQYAQGTRSAADEHAQQVRQEADAEVAALRAEVEAEVAALRAKAESVLVERTTEAEFAAAEIRTEADGYAREVRSAADTYSTDTRSAADAYAADTRSAADAYRDDLRARVDLEAAKAADAAEAARAEADRDAERRVAAAEREAGRIVDAAREQGRGMVEEARAYRERIIADLADRRRAVRAELDQVVAARDAVAVALSDVAGRIEASHQALHSAVLDPRSLGDVTADREALPEPEPLAELEARPRVEEPAGEAVAEEEGEGEAGASDEDVVAEAEPGAEGAAVAEEALPEEVAEAGAEGLPEDEAASGPEDLPEEAAADAVEAEAEPEPEPEPESEPESEEAAGPSGEASTDPVEAVFAQLKAQRNHDSTGAAEEATEGEGEEAAAEPGTDEEPAVGRAAASGEDAGLLDRRDATTDELERQLARRLKRLLSDEQNEALDRLRRAKGVPSSDEVLLAEGEHLGRYHAAALEDLVAAERAGASFFGEAPRHKADVGDVAGEFAAELVRQLRGRLDAAFADGGDEAEISDRIRACYREWKTQRIADTAAHYVLVAFNRGVSGATEGAARWLVDDGDAPCPDCDDNALAGAVPSGEPFPTGDFHPPAHPGCRCLAVPA